MAAPQVARRGWLVDGVECGPGRTGWPVRVRVGARTGGRGDGGTEGGRAGVADDLLAPGPAEPGAPDQGRVVGLPALAGLDRVADLVGQLGHDRGPVHLLRP